MKKHYIFFCLLSFLISSVIQAQDCQSTIIIKLVNMSRGGFFSGQTVQLTSMKNGDVYENTTDTKGEAAFLVPCGDLFDVTISNYDGKEEVMSPPYPNSASQSTYSYEANMIEKSKAFAMSESQKKATDRAFENLPDTTFVKGAVMPRPWDVENYAEVDITLIGFKNEFLVNEEVTFTGKKRNKSFKAHTDGRGHVRVYLPKGDIYNINFKYHKNYDIEEVKYTKGTSTTTIKITYMGTVEYLRRKKEEEKRMEQERKQAKLMMAAGSKEYRGDRILEVVLDRNNWTNKLLISDVSYEMLDYAMKLAKWYNANRKAGQTTQFVLFYNGQKRQGSESGSAFHLTSPEYNALVDKINYVHANEGLETAEHDIQGLIMNGGIEEGYDDVILFVDKDAPLTDYQYFAQLKAPVHVVLCVDQRRPNPQHLTVAWKTKGSIHTLSGDYTTIGQLKEGDSFELEGYKYKIMGGEFILDY